MKNKILFVVVIALVISVTVIASTGPTWASALRFPSKTEDPRPLKLAQLGAPSQQFDKISIAEDGIYYLGGVCAFEVDYKNTGLRDDVDIDVPVSFSRDIPYNSPNNLSTLLLPGCHVVHYREDQVVDSVSTEDGQWSVCFGERPEANLVIYYYLDSAQPKVWTPLATSHQNGLACASALYTGEYAPASEPPISEGVGGDVNSLASDTNPGSIVPPSKSITITKSGRYSVGGICTLIVEHKKDTIQDQVHVQDPVNGDPIDWETNLTFPTENGLLYQPGCHVLHYEDDDIVRWEQSTADDGNWTICFAARPDKEMTIYYYLGDLTDYASQWTALESTTENGMVCAPAQFTGMYTPGGKDK